MIDQNIFIINYNLLYEILDEIKENLPFEIIKYADEDSFVKDNRFISKNSLLVKKSNQKLFIKNDIDERNILNLQNDPISVVKLVELINIQLIKIRFNHQSKVKIKEYELNLNSKFFSKQNIFLKLTEKEIEIILYLDKNKTKHTILDLQKKIWGYTVELETHTVETHIYRLRKKISKKFKDDKFILTDLSGYFIHQIDI